MPLKRSGQASVQKPVLAMPTRPLGLVEQHFVEDALAETAPEWTVDLEGICDGEASLVLLPEGGDDMIGPSFVISRETFGFTLDEVQWDTIREVGSFAALGDVVAAVEARLASACCLGYLLPPTRH